MHDVFMIILMLKSSLCLSLTINLYDKFYFTVFGAGDACGDEQNCGNDQKCKDQVKNCKDQSQKYPQKTSDGESGALKVANLKVWTTAQCDQHIIQDWKSRNWIGWKGLLGWVSIGFSSFRHLHS